MPCPSTGSGRLNGPTEILANATEAELQVVAVFVERAAQRLPTRRVPACAPRLRA